ncbi:FMRFamide-related neuropeptides-like [Macrobrachium rosenbergii]|uniref:FMRFamide-related neuropeptides-like n=1 Tax=Macrobrachium rosenbergii TaxID=79674 RepID=UPI0034D3A861
MIVTSWIVLGLLSCLCQALKPPVSVGLPTDNSDDGSLALPEKRGNVDRSFIRFGRSGAEEKRGVGKSFLRFGRAGADYEDDESASLSANKRDRNFLRFGRNRNFLRFGRSGPEDIGLEEGPIDVPIPVPEESAEVDNIRRSALSNRNFLRFGRQYNKNFLRFGRSVDTSISCDDC